MSLDHRSSAPDGAPSSGADMTILQAIVNKMVQIKKRDEVKRKERRAVVNRSMEVGAGGAFSTFASL